jgi:branched-subunit amino acid aminotransferase/4-amino-4-deoxychorismate lyase
MSAVQLFAVTADGPEILNPPAPVSGIHDLPAALPFGVYTAFRTFEHNQFLELQAHLVRLVQSMALSGWSYVLDQNRLRQALHAVCTAYPGKEARVRVDVLAGPATLLGSMARELVTLAPYAPLPERAYREGVGVAVAARLQRADPLIKRADFVRARRDVLPDDPTVHEYLLRDEAGHLLEGSSSNFYGVRAGALWTAGEGVLEGITRRIVLRLAAELAIPVRLEAPLLGDVPRLDEAFLSSASRGVLPVVAIGARSVGNGRPGAVTGRLLAAYRAYVAQAIAPAL